MITGGELVGPLCQIAECLFQNFKQAPYEYDKIDGMIAETEYLLSRLRDLEHNSDLLQADMDFLQANLKECKKHLHTMNRWQVKYADLQKDPKFSKLVKRVYLRLKFSPEDVKREREGINDTSKRCTKLLEKADKITGIPPKEDVANGINPSKIALDQRNYLGDYLERRQPGTGTWLLNGSEYIEWHQSNKATVVCTGIPGSGKTVMAATIVDDLQTTYGKDPKNAVIYHFCHYKRQTSQEIETILASLVWQLYHDQHDLPENKKQLYELHCNQGHPSSLLNYKSVLTRLINSHARVFVILDAVDECSEGPDGILKALLSVQTDAKASVNVLATVRDASAILQTHRELQNCPQIEVRARREDIECFMNTQIRLLNKGLLGNPKLHEEVKEAIINAADGMFLLAVLHVESIRDEITASAIREALGTLSNGSNAISEKYDEIIQRIDNHMPKKKRDRAHQILSLIVYAKRELSIQELQEAIVAKREIETIDRENDLADEEAIISDCAGLVTLDRKSRVVRLVHYTAQEHMERKKTTWPPRAQSVIAEACLNYLSMRRFNCGRLNQTEELQNILKANHFLGYASQNWGYHVKESGDVIVQKKVLPFLDYPKRLDFIRQAMDARSSLKYYGGTSQSVEEVTPLHIAAYFGLRDVCAELLDQGSPVNARDSDGSTPLTYAAGAGQLETVQLLLEQDDVDLGSTGISRGTALCWATKHGQMEIVQLLLQQDGVDVNSAPSSGRTPLHLAMYNRHSVLSELLIDHGADVNAKDEQGIRPLPFAIMNNDVKLLQLLLKSGKIKIEMLDRNGKTPLQLAAGRGHLEVTRLLIQHGAVVNAKTKHGFTPLHWAIMSDHAELSKPFRLDNSASHDLEQVSAPTPRGDIDQVKLLIQHGADVNARVRRAVSALALAVQEGDIEIVHTLLQHGAVVDCFDSCGRTPVALAQNRGYFGIEQLLRQFSGKNDEGVAAGATPPPPPPPAPPAQQGFYRLGSFSAA